MIFSSSDNAGGKGEGKRAALQVLQRFIFFIIGKGSKCSAQNNAFAEHAGQSSVWGQCWKERCCCGEPLRKGEKNSSCRKTHRTPRNVGSNSGFVLLLFKHVSERDPPASPRMPQHGTGERAMVKHFVLTLRCLNSREGQEQDASCPAAISPFCRVEVGPFKPGTCQCPVLGCVQTPPSNAGRNCCIWLKCPLSAKTWGRTLKLGAQKEKLNLSHAFSIYFFDLV